MENKILTYVAIGDSLTLGIGSMFQPDFVSRYTESLEEAFNCKVEKSVFARNGATTSQILKYFKKKKVRDAIKKADVITISGGGNDLKQAARDYFKAEDETVFENAIQLCMKNIALILEEIEAIKVDHDSYFIRVIGLYNPYTQLDFSHKWIHLFNQNLKKFNHDHIRIADVNGGFIKGGKSVLSIDRLHPNKEGYKIISDVLMNTGYDPLLEEDACYYLYPCIEKKLIGSNA